MSQQEQIDSVYSEQLRKFQDIAFRGNVNMAVLDEIYENQRSNYIMNTIQTRVNSITNK